MPAPERTRGLTLLELLIAIALVLALAAVSVPAVMSGWEDRLFEHAAEDTIHQLALARAEAQLSARPVEVRYLSVNRSVEARWFQIDDDRDETPPRIGEGWTVRRLPRGLELRRAGPESIGVDTAAAFSGDDDDAIRLAVYLPDGTSLFGERLWLHDADGRVGRLEVNPLTGRVTFTRHFATDDAVLDEDEPDDVDLRPADVGDAP